MRGVDSTPHRVWRYAVLAWVFLVAWASARAVLPWHLGIVGMLGMIGEMRGVHKPLLAYASSYAAPMALFTFGMIAPLATAIDHMTRGRTSRVVNVLLGGALAVAVISVVLWWEGSSIEYLLAHHGSGPLLPLPLTGMIVGLGMRHRKSARPR
jgi:hypothetical protein